MFISQVCSLGANPTLLWITKIKIAVAIGVSLDYEQSIFPLRDGRGKRITKRVQKSPGTSQKGCRLLELAAHSV